MKRLFNLESPLMVFLIHVFDCVLLSLLWILFSLPIITIGAASTALYTTVYRYLRRDEGTLWRTFWKAFRENAKRSTLVWLAALAVLVILTVDVLVSRTLLITGQAMGFLYWGALVLLCVAVTWCAYLAAYSARCNGSVREVLRISFLLMLFHPIRALGVLAPILAGTAIVLVIPSMVIFLPAATCWISSVVIEPVFRLHMRSEDLDKETSEP